MEKSKAGNEMQDPAANFADHEVAYFVNALAGFDYRVKLCSDGIGVFTGANLSHVLIRKDLDAESNIFFDGSIPAIEQVTMQSVAGEDVHVYPFVEANNDSTILTFVTDVFVVSELTELCLANRSASDIVTEYIEAVVSESYVCLSNHWLEEFERLLRYNVIAPNRVQAELIKAHRRERQSLKTRFGNASAAINRMFKTNNLNTGVLDVE